MTVLDELVMIGAKSSDEIAIGAKFWSKNAGLLDEIASNPSMVKGLTWAKGGNKDDLLAELVTKMDKASMIRVKGWNTTLKNAIGQVDSKSYANLVQVQGTQASSYAGAIVKDLGLPARASKSLTKTLNNTMEGMWKNGTLDNARSLIGKVEEPTKAIAKGSDNIVVSTAKGGGILDKIVNGTYGIKAGAGAVKAKPLTSVVVLATVLYVIGFDLPLRIGAGIVSTFEKWGFLPTGSTNGLIAMWGRLRSIITVVIFGGLLVATFYIMNVLFGAAKSVKSGIDTVADAVTPDAKPSGA